MGGTTYSLDDRSLRTKMYSSKSVNENFVRKSIHNDMNPADITVRECRDSEAHPTSLPIIIGLDVTASMGHIPQSFIQHGLPNLMSFFLEKGVVDPALLFMGIGDHFTDSYPLQVGQFESGDKELDHWLENLYLESGGGGNHGESYLLSWLFAQNYVVTDHFEKRNKKGYIFTIGDDAPHYNMKEAASVFNNNDLPISEPDVLYDDLLLNWNIYHFNVPTTTGKREYVTKSWRNLIGDSLIQCEDYQNIPFQIAEIIIGDNGESEVYENPESQNSWENKDTL